MKITGKLIIISFALLALVASAYAQSPRKELQQMVEQLRKTPNDPALRQQIIKLVQELKPVPAIPEAAREPFVMGATVLKKASDTTGVSKAVDLFTQALNIAPWFAEAYYNRAIAQETAGQFEAAIDDLKTYLDFKLSDTERREVQDKIYSLKADVQLASAKKAEQDKISRAEDGIRRFEGAWQRSALGGGGEWHVLRRHVRHRPGSGWSITYSADNSQEQPSTDVRDIKLVGSELRFTSEEIINNAVCGTYEVRGAVSSDGRSLSLEYTLMPLNPNRPLFCPLAKYYGSHVDTYTKQ
ncbi:MAG: tetratricopeptide repeat protein [Desulfuromonadaceae bacterium]